jgi:RNA polymerase sigma factor (sigma-70 family)
VSDPGDRSARGAGTAVDDADRDVLGRIAAGELDALEELYDRYRTMAYSIALRITTDAALAEDVVQDAFLGAWRNANRYLEDRGSVKTWLLAIVHHRAVDAVRRRRPTTELPDRDMVPPEPLTIPDIWPEVAGRLDQESVREALGALSDSQREALELAYFGGLTQQEIAARTGAPLGTVKSRMRLGLLAMRRALVGEPGEPASGGANRDAGADRDGGGWAES